LFNRGSEKEVFVRAVYWQDFINSSANLFYKVFSLEWRKSLKNQVDMAHIK